MFIPGPYHIKHKRKIYCQQSETMAIGVVEQHWPDSEDTAKLFAAAPDMLEALLFYINEFPAFRSKPVGAPNSDARKAQENLIEAEDKALAAISKVKEG
jgi:hypothetical protein